MKTQQCDAMTTPYRASNKRLSFISLVMASMIACLSLTSVNAEAKEKIYRWVDENGVTHYGEKPPEKEVQVDKIKTRKDYSSDAKAARQALEEKRKARDEASTAPATTKNEDAERVIAERKKKLEEGCKTAKKNLEVLSTHGRVKETAEDGTPKYLSEEEHADRIRKTTQYLNDNCAPAQ